jgi:hypothetical protein
MLIKRVLSGIMEASIQAVTVEALNASMALGLVPALKALMRGWKVVA